jgi:hypothetical protein
MNGEDFVTLGQVDDSWIGSHGWFGPIPSKAASGGVSIYLLGFAS